MFYRDKTHGGVTVTCENDLVACFRTPDQIGKLAFGVCHGYAHCRTHLMDHYQVH